jgi:hypothetical protein
MKVCERCLLTIIDHRPTTNDRRLTTSDRNSYNSPVNAPVPTKPVADNNAHDKHQHRHAVYAAEATGLLVIALLLLVLVVIRYWQYIPWKAR